MTDRFLQSQRWPFPLIPRFHIVLNTLNLARACIDDRMAGGMLRHGGWPLAKFCSP
jgi:hypothetical protein